jgi:glucokinase
LKENFIISIDMGGTKILSAALNTKEGIICKVKKPTSAHEGKDTYIKKLSEIIFETIETAGLTKEQIKAVCLGIPGSVDPYSGIIGVAPNLGIKNFNIKEELQNVVPFPVLIENDVNIAALGINKYSLAKTAKNALVVFIGTGIGGALIFDKKLYRGSSFFAGEIGHMIIDKDGPLCGCGKKGCFEAIASRAAIVKTIVKDIKAKKPSKLTKLVTPGKQIKSKALANAVKLNDRLVIRHITAACEVIGRELANVTNLLNVDLIVLGGGLIEALDKFMVPKIREAFKNNALKDAAKVCKIKAGKLGEDAALFGGIVLAEEFLKIKI